MKLVKKGIILFPLFFLLFACHHLTLDSFSHQVQFLNEQIIKGQKTFQGFLVGGLSGAAYDSQSRRFFFISDDKKNHRFYELSIKSQKPYRLEITKQTFLKERGENRLARRMDPEAILFYPSRKELFIASEGQQIYSPPEPPQIYRFSFSGVLQKVWPVPLVFWNREKGSFFGTRENKGFESLALDLENQILWTATEEPLKQDTLSFKNQWIRVSGFSLKTRELIFQHGYKTKNPHTGLVEMLLLKPFVFLTLEREYKKFFKRKGNKDQGDIEEAPHFVVTEDEKRSFSIKINSKETKGVNKVQLFLTDCRKSSNLYKKIRLPLSFNPCRKILLFDFDDLPQHIKVDNLEAMTFGPQISPTQKLLVFISDNNFNPREQKNQILFFKFSQK